MVKLDILSDPICPWCYIGKTQLDRALLQMPNHPFTIEWHPFQLNPEMPKSGMDRRDYLERKFGGKEGAVRVYSQIEAHAKSLNLPIDFSAMKRTPNTIDAHRLIYWAGLEQKQNEVVQSLFEAYFCKGEDIGDAEVLSKIGSESGMDETVLKRLLSGASDIDSIEERDAHSRKMGVNSVPTFIVANQHVVPGAQTAEVWTKVIEEVNDNLSKANT